MPIKINKAKQSAFLSALSQCGNLTTAATLSNLDRGNHYRWLNNDPGYKKRFESAMEEAEDHMSAEARRRAVEGYEEPVYGSGGKDVGTVKVGTVRKYSDTLLMFMLKAANPQRYRDRIDHQHTGSGGGPIQTSVTIQQVMDLLDSRDNKDEGQG